MSSLDLTAAAARPASVSQTVAVDTTPPEQHSLGRSIALHLLPGLAGFLVFLLAGPVLADAGWPALFAFYGPMTATIASAEVGILLWVRRTRRGTGDTTPMIDLRGQLTWPRLGALAVALFLVGTVLTGVLALVDQALVTSVFAGLPSWWLVSDASAITAAPATLLAITLAVGFVMNGFLGPVVEESYFRGYLLPRLSRFGRWAPVLNSVLFSVYHFWQPWTLVSRIGYVLPYALAVQRTRSVGLGMVVHSAANLLGLIFLVGIAMS